MRDWRDQAFATSGSRRHWLASALGLAALAGTPAAVRAAAGRSEAPAPTVAPVAGPGPQRLPVPPSEVRIRFGVYYRSHVDGFQLAEVAYQFAHDGERYAASTAGQAVGPIALIYQGVLSQRSVGRVTGAGLAPLLYAEKRGNRAEREVAFDREVAQVRFPNGTSAALVDGVQDRLSMVWQLGLLARAEPARFDAGAEHLLPLASFSRIDEARIVSDGVKTLSDGAQRWSTLHLVRPAEPGRQNETIELWLDRERQMQPVRIRITDREGRVLDHFRLPRAR